MPCEFHEAPHMFSDCIRTDTKSRASVYTLARLFFFETHAYDGRYMTYAVAMLTEAAGRAGYEFYIEPRYGYVGYIVLPNGTKKYFKDTTLDINSSGASRIAKDKDYTCMFLSDAGFATVTGKGFYSPAWSREIGESYDTDAPFVYAYTRGYPLIVKPNDSSGGHDVYSISDAQTLARRLKRLFMRHNIVRVEEKLVGRDMRFVVVGGELVVLLERTRPVVVGNGIDTLHTLLKRTSIHGSSLRRATIHARESGNTLSRVLDTYERYEYLPNANLSSGGSVVDVSYEITPALSAWASRVAQHMGLSLCAIDAIAIDTKGALTVESLKILEVNSAPSFKRFAESSPEAFQKTEAIYDKIVQAMAS